MTRSRDARYITDNAPNSPEWSQACDGDYGVYGPCASCVSYTKPFSPRHVGGGLESRRPSGLTLQSLLSGREPAMVYVESTRVPAGTVAVSLPVFATPREVAMGLRGMPINGPDRKLHCEPRCGPQAGILLCISLAYYRTDGQWSAFDVVSLLSSIVDPPSVSERQFSHVKCESDNKRDSHLAGQY